MDYDSKKEDYKNDTEGEKKYYVGAAAIISSGFLLSTT